MKQLIHIYRPYCVTYAASSNKTNVTPGNLQ